MREILSLAYTGFYILLAGSFALLAFFSGKEDLPPFARDPPLLRPVRRMAVFLYRKAQERGQRQRRQGKESYLPGEESVRNDLLVLYPALKARRSEIRFQIDKISRLLVLLLVVILAAGGLRIRSLCSGILQENGKVEREQAGGADRSLRVTALPSEEGTDEGAHGQARQAQEDYGTYTVVVRARRYTQKEAEERVQDILDRFPQELLGDNLSADQIRTPLSMPSPEETEPFAVSWESSRYAVLDTDGSIYNRDYTDEQAEEVELTAFLTYEDYRFQKKMKFCVRAPVRDEKERLRGAISSALQEAEKKTASGPSYILPTEVGGLLLTWREKTEDLSAPVLLIGTVISLLAWYATDSRLHEKTKERSRQLAIDYPRLTSRIALYLGAGMSVRGIFYKCAADYREKQSVTGQKRKEGEKISLRRTGAGKRYLYEEILLVCNELDSGVPEAEAYMHFGRRCRSRQYTKLASLLVQNLRRGNDTLLQVLQEEAQSSFEERKNLARELGEEAGTKLLLPMMIMLGVTMLIIIVPAYFGFSM